MTKTIYELYPYHANPSEDHGIRDWNFRMHDKREAYKEGALAFSKYIKENYSIVKGGKYRHRGDFVKNDKPLTEEQVYENFVKIDH